MRTHPRSSVATAVVCFAAALAFTTATARADGLVYVVPAEGTASAYDLKLTVTNDGQQRQHSGRLQVRAAGTEEHAEEQCRWIEFKLSDLKTEGQSDLPDETIRVLVPEKYLKAGEPMDEHIVKAWRQRGEEAGRDIDPDGAAFNIGPVSMFLTGRLKDAQKLEAEEIEVPGLGKVRCERESGMREMPVGPNGSRPVKVTVWRTEKAPFGAAKMQMAMDMERDGRKQSAVFVASLAQAQAGGGGQAVAQAKTAPGAAEGQPAVVPATPRGGGDARPGRAGAETGRSRAEGETKDDMALVQGRWERKVTGNTEGPVVRVTKEIKGNKEVVTYYDKDGKVTRQHQVNFILDTAGPVKLFTYSNQEVLQGPDKGQKYPGTVSYIYRVNQREFGEVWGFLPGQEQRTVLLLVWQKAKADSEGQPKESREAAGQ